MSQVTHPKRVRVRVAPGTTLAAALQAQRRPMLQRETPVAWVGSSLHVRLAAQGQRAQLGGRRARLQWPVATPGYLAEDSGPVRPGEVPRTEAMEGSEPECCAELRKGDTLGAALARALPRQIREWSPPEGWGFALVTIRLAVTRSS